MYIIQTEGHFDAAHFLAEYAGKCKNIHGHRWRVQVRIKQEQTEESGNSYAMVADFADVKADLNTILSAFDHVLIYEDGTLRQQTVDVLTAEGFALRPIPFRPTAESFARYFYEQMRGLGYPMASVRVYETEHNMAEYTE